ncbi:MAG TPA: hypothetical protein DHW02_05320 [Ktedonobacter sp.]|nr:hypothetical protein [Ktedonobacter sp.]
MRKTIIRIIALLVTLLVLLTALIAVVRFAPYACDFSAYPKSTRTASGGSGDPINLLFVGSKEQITHSFQQASWLIPDPITPQTSARIAADSLAHRSYPTAPISNLYVFGRVQDLAFEKPTSDVQYRGHIRIWQTGTHLGGQPIWIGAATYDSGIELSSTKHFPTHHIAPTVDLERNAVGADLAKTGVGRSEIYAAFTPPIFFARNGGGDYYESDGDILVINSTQTSIPLQQSSGVIEGLKTGLFLFYDALFTVVGAMLAFLGLVVFIIIGLTLWRLTERSHSPSF